MKRTSLIGAVLVVVCFFASPDLYLWKTVDNYQEPLRFYGGDSAHYLAVAHSAMVDGQPNSNAYFFEPTEDHSQFFLTQSFFAFWSKVFGITSVVLVDLFMRIGVAVATFGILYILLSRFGVPWTVSLTMSLLAVLAYGSIAFRGFALGYWFLPLILGSLYTAVRFEEETEASSLFRWSLFGVLLSAIHPVYFLMSGLAFAVLWFERLRSVTFKKESLFWALGWVVISGILFIVLYGAFLVPSLAVRETLYRIVAIDTRLLIHPLYSIRLLLLGYVAYSLFKKNAYAAYSLAALVGLNSYILTGTYVANDHYAYIIEDFMVYVLGVAIVWGSRELDMVKKGRLGLVALCVFVVTAFERLNYLSFRPGYLGRWAPLLAGYFLIGIVLCFPRIRVELRRLVHPAVLVGLVLLSIVYGGVLISKDYAPDLFAHRVVNTRRELIETLRVLPKGVVLADPAVSESVLLFTNHKVYWSSGAFSETATNQELLLRWQDEKLFFENHPHLNGDYVWNTLLGTAQRCQDNKRDRVYKIFSGFGINQFERTLCDPVKARAERTPGFEKLFQSYKDSIEKDQNWSPAFRVDYLILTDDMLPKFAPYFEKIEEIGDFTIYRFIRK